VAGRTTAGDRVPPIRAVWPADAEVVVGAVIFAGSALLA
jgi:hypothetical protein